MRKKLFVVSLLAVTVARGATPECLDSDEGNNALVKGIVIVKSIDLSTSKAEEKFFFISKPDLCLDERTLEEQSCQGKEPVSKKIDCFAINKKCLNGACE